MEFKASKESGMQNFRIVYTTSPNMCVLCNASAYLEIILQRGEGVGQWPSNVGIRVTVGIRCRYFRNFDLLEPLSLAAKGVATEGRDAGKWSSSISRLVIGYYTIIPWGDESPHAMWI